jgi:DtxR family Mn-dependent transcriptional regulator
MSELTPRLSVSVEDYLKVIYTLSGSEEAASTSAIAEALGVQPASVTGMVKRLAESGYLTHVPYRGVTLTPDGNREALRIIRRHRIIETYLCTRLGYAWEDVHDEAERMEHAASEKLIERMAEALEEPTHDPHGAPIPTADGEIDARAYPTLADSHGDRLRVRSVSDDDPHRLRYLEEQSLRPGVLLRVVDRAPFNGPITVRLTGNQGQPVGKPVVLGFDLASRIFVSTES